MTRIEMDLFVGIKKAIVRHTYVESLTNLCKLGYLSPEEYRNELCAINELNGFKLKPFWNREVKDIGPEEDHSGLM